MVGRLYHLGPGEPRARADELLERFDLADAGGRLVAHLLGRHAPPPRPRRGARRPAAGALPRRADDRPRPAQPARPVGDDRGARRRRARRCCSPPSTSTRPTGSPTRSRDRPRPRDRRGHVRRAQGPGRRRAARDHARATRRDAARGDRGARADAARAPAVGDGVVCACRSRERSGRDRRGGAPRSTRPGIAIDDIAIARPDARRRLPLAHRPRGRGAEDEEEAR